VLEELTISITFYLIAAIAVVSALGVIVLRDIFKAALCLVLLFMSVAGVYMMLHADFLAIIQILIYVGAISVLIIVAVMLTRDVRQGFPLSKIKYPAVIVALLLICLIGYGLINTAFALSTKLPLDETIKPIGKQLFSEGGYLLTVEMAAVLLLSAILGAIAIIREK
jgi:NADH-quinone oxidoreductase subunit J